MYRPRRRKKQVHLGGIDRLRLERKLVRGLDRHVPVGRFRRHVHDPTQIVLRVADAGARQDDALLAIRDARLGFRDLDRRERADLDLLLVQRQQVVRELEALELDVEEIDGRVEVPVRLFGLGEKASLDIPQEQPGILPSETPKSGMGMMTSFGDGITFTPLGLAALMGAVANGGTLYYLQYPRTSDAAGRMLPQIKRRLDIELAIPEIKPGMLGAVEYGTARRIGADPNEPIYGKTGTCTDTRTPTHLGWFGSFGEVNKTKLVVVVMLTGGRLVNGPAASGVAGQVYRHLAAQGFGKPPAITVVTTAAAN